MTAREIRAVNSGRVRGDVLDSSGTAWSGVALGLVASLVVSAAVLLAGLAMRPHVLAAGGAVVAIALAAHAWRRREGWAGLWVAALVFSVLAGEMSAVPLGGQSGRLLWADLVIATGVFAALWRGRGSIDVVRAPFLDAWLAFTALGAVSLLVATDALTGMAELKEWMAAWAAGAAALAYARDARAARVLLVTVAVCGACIGLWMAAVTWTAPAGPVLTVLMKQVDLPWGRSNYLAGILILCLPVALGLLASASHRGERIALAAVIAAQGLGLALSASKGAILALVVALAVGFVTVRRVPRAMAGIAIVLVALGAAAFIAGPLREVLTYRMQSSAIDYSIGERMDLYALALDLFSRSPVTGVGLNNFSVASNQLRGLDTVPHNLELGFLAELGVGGFALACLLLLAMGRAAWQLVRRSQRPGLALGLWVAFLAFAIHNQFESTLYGQQFKIILVVASAATYRLATATKPEKRLLRN